MSTGSGTRTKNASTLGWVSLDLSPVKDDFYHLHTVVRWGKHNGKKMEDIIDDDPSYVTWLMNEQGIKLDKECLMLYKVCVREEWARKQNETRELGRAIKRAASRLVQRRREDDTT